MELVKRIIINNVCHCDCDLEFFFAKFTHHCTSVSLTLPTISPTDGIEMKSKHSDAVLVEKGRSVSLLRFS